MLIPPAGGIQNAEASKAKEQVYPRGPEECVCMAYLYYGWSLGQLQKRYFASAGPLHKNMHVY